MKQIHNRLTQKYGWYKSYHALPNTALVNWLVLLAIVLFFTIVIVLSSRSSPLTSRAGFSLNARQNLVSILGDGGMLDSGTRVLLYIPNTGQRHGDCIESSSPYGPGPQGNLITESDNERTDWPDSELNLANKCAKPASGSSSLNWYHWSAELGNAGNPDNRVTVNHQWSSKDSFGNYITGFSGQWLPAPGAIANAQYSLRIGTEVFGGQSRRTWSASLTSGGRDYNTLLFYAPMATDYRQILFNRWFEGPRVVFQAWVKLNQTLTSPNSLGYRFAAPELEGCWKFDGSACSESAGDVVRFLAFDLNPDRVDICTPSSIFNCPPFHLTESGEKISKTDTARYPYDAYYFWCGSKFDSTLSEGEQCPDFGSKSQEIYQLAPHSVWARFGAPVKPLRLDEQTLLRIDIGGVADQVYGASRYPQNLRFNKIYIGPEMFSPNTTVSWQTAGFDVLKPVEPPQPQADVTPPTVTGIRAAGISASQVAVSWETNEKTTGAVQYQLVDDKGNSLFKHDYNNSLRHAVVIGELQPSTTYTYQIVANDVAGNRTVTPIQTFTTGKGNPTPTTNK